MASSEGLPQERVVGRYALYGEIASGGMATVHFGRMVGSVGFSKTVAIKRLHENYARDPEFVSMFLDEARLAARIQHPNVVSTLDIVATDGELFLVMEYIKGESLSRLMRTARRGGEQMPPRIVATIVSGLLHGLHAAHEATDEQGQPLGIVHRDVSPQNVLVGTDGVARVLDFGVAKAAGRLTSTRDGQLKGKFAYMAPEQVRGGAIDRRTDIFAAAVVLWEALTGRRMVEGDSEAVVLTKVLEGAKVKPSEMSPGLPRSLDVVTMRGLEADPNKRYPTAREMAFALERAVGLASQREVGEWVERAATDALALRAMRIKEIESRSSPRLSRPELNDSMQEVLTPSGQQSARAVMAAAGMSGTGANMLPPGMGGTGSGVFPPGMSGSGANMLPPGMGGTGAGVPGMAGSGANLVPTVTEPSGQVPFPMGDEPRSVASRVTGFTGVGEMPPQPRQGSNLALMMFGGAALLFAGVAVAALVMLARGPAPSPAPVATAPVATTASAAPAASPQPTAAKPAATQAAQPSASSAAPAESAAPAATAAAAAATGAPAAKKPAGKGSDRPAGGASKPAGGDCDIPFTIDAQGVKHPKPQCF